jgi:hypothetical protein
MTMFFSGIVLLCGFAVLDVFIRLRMKRIGYKWVFLRGGTLNYNDYLRLRSKHGWSAWPVYVMWTLLIAGLVLVIVGVSKYGANS